MYNLNSYNLSAFQAPSSLNSYAQAYDQSHYEAPLSTPIDPLDYAFQPSPPFNPYATQPPAFNPIAAPLFVKPSAHPLEDDPIDPPLLYQRIDPAIQENDATKNWIEKTKHCKTLRIIEGIALVAIALVALAATATLFISCGLAAAPLTTLGIVLLGVGGSVGIITPPLALIRLGIISDPKKHYDNPQTAQNIVDDLRTFSNFSSYSDSKIDNLFKYGFIKNDKILVRTIKRTKRNLNSGFQQELKDIYDQDIKPNLPNPRRQFPLLVK